MSFGQRLKQVRKEKKKTQSEVAKLLGIDDTTISKYENDKSEPDNETLKRLSKLYLVNTHWLHTGTGDKYINNIKPDTISENTETYGTSLSSPKISTELTELLAKEGGEITIGGKKISSEDRDKLKQMILLMFGNEKSD